METRNRRHRIDNREVIYSTFMAYHFADRGFAPYVASDIHTKLVDEARTQEAMDKNANIPAPKPFIKKGLR